MASSNILVACVKILESLTHCELPMYKGLQYGSHLIFFFQFSGQFPISFSDLFHLLLWI